MREWANFTRHELDRLKVVIAELRQQLDALGGHSDGESILDLLSLGYVYKLDGSVDRNGNEILVLPRDVELSHPDFVRLVNYIQKRWALHHAAACFTQLTFLTRRETKLLVLVDRRQSTWFSVKRCLKLLNETLTETRLNVTVWVFRSSYDHDSKWLYVEIKKSKPNTPVERYPRDETERFPSRPVRSFISIDRIWQHSRQG